MDNNVHGDEILNKLEALDLDVKQGLKYCGDMGFYIEVLGISLELYEERRFNLNQYYNDKDYNSYTILVHSMKSGLANIGAMELCKKARALEEAGKDGNYKYIIEKHSVFMSEYECFMKGLHNIVYGHKDMETTGQRMAPEKKVDDWGIILDSMEQNLQELELDMVLELVDEILLCDIESWQRELMTTIKNNLHHFDVEGAKKNLGALKNQCGIL